MNYFELFEIPVQLKVDKASLPQKFFELSRRYHPDFFINSPEKERAEALERSAMLNRAFRIFQNQDETIKYVLQLKGLLQEEEKYELPPDFLMEVLEINEELMEDPGNENTGSKVEYLQNEIYDPVKDIIDHYQEGKTSEQELLRVKEYYYKKKYLDRIRKELK